MTSYKYIRADVAGRVMTITMNRPEVMNALHPPAHAEMARAFDEYAARDDIWICVVTGAGDRAFCTGSDLKERARLGHDDMPSTGFAGITERFDLDKPVIARINGHCIGGGLEIALACDLAIASEGARFGLPEPRVGLAAMGGLHRLFRQVPYKKAMELALTGRLINAEEALGIGLINSCVPSQGLNDAVDALCKTLLACAPLSLRATKQVAVQGLDATSLESAFNTSYPAAERMLASKDAREGPEAFAEKRSPEWKGR